jgi:hypothetical protein
MNFVHTTSCYGAFVSLHPPCTCTPRNASKLCTSLILSVLTQLYLHFACSTFDFHFVFDTTHFTFNICNFLQTTTCVAHHCSCSTGSVLTSCTKFCTPLEIDAATQQNANANPVLNCICQFNILQFIFVNS